MKGEPSPRPPTFGRRLTQHDIAVATGWTRQYVGKLEKQALAKLRAHPLIQECGRLLDLFVESEEAAP